MSPRVPGRLFFFDRPKPTANGFRSLARAVGVADARAGPLTAPALEQFRLDHLCEPARGRHVSRQPHELGLSIDACLLEDFFEVGLSGRHCRLPSFAAVSVRLRPAERLFKQTLLARCEPEGRGHSFSLLAFIRSGTDEHRSHGPRIEAAPQIAARQRKHVGEPDRLLTATKGDGEAFPAKFGFIPSRKANRSLQFPLPAAPSAACNTP